MTGNIEFHGAKREGCGVKKKEKEEERKSCCVWSGDPPFYVICLTQNRRHESGDGIAQDDEFAVEEMG